MDKIEIIISGNKNEKTSDINKISEVNVFPTERETIATLFALLESLSYEVLSGDIWWLAMDSAKNNAVKKYGVPQKVVDEIMARFDKARKTTGSSNSMSSMF